MPFAPATYLVSEWERISEMHERYAREFHLQLSEAVEFGLDLSGPSSGLHFASLGSHLWIKKRGQQMDPTRWMRGFRAEKAKGRSPGNVAESIPEI